MSANLIATTSDGGFTTSGNIEGNYFIGNGSQLTGISGGSGNTGNVTFSNQIVIGTGGNDGTGGLYLASGPDGVANTQYLRVRGGDNFSHIHLDTSNSQAYDQYFGNDAKYVKLELGDAGNVVVGTDDAAGNSYNWTFTSGGNFILANGNSVIQSIANSSLDPTLPNVSTMTLTPDQNYNSQALVLDPTAPGHIHLRAYAFSNIDDPAANIFLGGEDTAFEVTSGANNEVRVHSGGNTWTFNNAGNLNLPGNLVIAGNANVFGTNSSLLQTTDNRPLIALSSGANGAVSSLWVEDIGNVGTSNIAAVYANPTVGSGIVRIAVGQNGVGSGPNLWDFDAAGNLTLPGNTFAVNYANGTAVSLGGGANTGNIIFDQSTIESNQSNAYINLNASGSGTLSLGTNDESNVRIVTDEGNVNNQWTFDTTGNLTLPAANSSILGGGNIVISGKDIPFGGSGVSGTVTIRGGIDATSPPSVQERVYINNTYIQGTTLGQDNPSANLNLYSADGMQLTTAGGGMRLEVGASFGAGSGMVLLAGAAGEVGNGGSIGITAGVAAFDPGNVWYGGNINISAGNASDNFGGAVNINSGVGIGNGTSGNINITSGTTSWIFDPTGNLTIPSTSGGFIKTASNASIGIVAMDNGTNNPAQLLSMNVGNGNATSIVSAYATNATIQTNASGNINTWQFDNAGNLTLPTGGQIIVSGGLVSSGASPAPTINGFSITNSVGISGNGNIAGNNISATGNVTAINLINTVTVYANLPAATTAGIRAFISDANLAPIGNFGVEVSGGGGNYVPVFSDGANWCIG